MTFREVLSFKKDKEKAFQLFYLRQDLIACRATSFLVILVMFILIGIDFYRVTDISWVLFARIFVSVTLGALIFLTYRIRLTPNQLQLALIGINIIFLASLFFMDAMTVMPSFYLTNSIGVFLFISATVSSLRYRYSSLLNITLVLFFLYYFPHSVNAVFQKSQITNIIISMIISLLIGFVWERNKRITFTQHSQMNSLLNIFSHDMVSPLNSLLGLLGLHDDQLITQSEFNEHVGKIKKSTANNILLLQNLVKWSKSQMDGFKPKVEQVNLNTIICDAINLLQNAAKEKEIEMTYTEVDALCLADPEMVKLIIRNTLSNAIKFSNANGVIEILSTRNGNSISLHIKDNGVGMTQDEIDRLFVMQVESLPGTANEHGSGIGLYITHQFVMLNNGEIKIESKKGSGSTVKISFPEFSKA